MPDGSANGPSATDIPEGLSWCADDSPGIERRRAGQGFTYRDPHGVTIQDPKVLDRIRALAIPPAWEDVWICPRANGHVQATGRDARGRKQYRYHAEWTAHAASDKFDRLPTFALALPGLRRQIEADLSLEGPCKAKVLATAVRLLEITLIRVGNARYARANRHYGLTTLHKRHLEVDGAALIFAFRGKSGVEHHVSVRDRRLSSVVRALRDLPGQHLFKYRDDQGRLYPVTSDDVNAYIRAAMGAEFSAKDFRTWAGTASAARTLREIQPPSSPGDAKKKITICVKTVSGLLGNTPTVCRSAYVHPLVFERFRRGDLADVLPDPDAADFDAALISLLQTASEK
ncbi:MULTISPECIES: DNA topoisomerase IB [unclassified Brevundimonas]|uniref:DNA topoisomerase IB n=1 Tax=unclassified Brevundimonas TaxID=2622653 RepID=UPI003F8F7911